MATTIDQLTEAADLHRSGEHELAESRYRDILRQTPDDPNALNLLGVLCAQSDRMSEARTLLQRAVRLAPRNAASHYNLANVLRSEGQSRTAVQHYRKAIDLDGDHRSALLNLAAAYLDLGRSREAIETYNALLRSDPDHVDARRSLAQTLIDAGECASAIIELRRCLNTDNADVESASLLGWLQFRAEDYEASAETWNDILAVDDLNVDAHHNRAQALRRLGRFEEAAESYRRAASLATNPERFQLRWVETLDESGHLDSSLDEVREALALDWAQASAWHQLGDLLREAGRYDLAADSYRAALKLDTKFGPSLTNLAGVLRASGAIEEAMRVAERAVEVSPDSSEAWTNLAAIHLDRRDAREAIRCASQAIASDPAAKAAHLCKVAASKQLGLNSDAITGLKSLVEALPDDPDARVRLGHLYRELGDLERAEEAYRSAMAIAPDFAEARVGLAKNLMFEQRLRRARKEIERAIQSAPNNTFAQVTLAELCTQEGRPSEAIELLIPLAEDEHQPVQNRQTIAYRLGDALDKVGRYEEAFAWYDRANRVIRIPYHHRSAQQLFDALISVFDADLIARLSAQACTSHTPIFIGGMPRSGTTLVEQILASHPESTGVGEVGIMGRTAGVIARLHAPDNVPYPNCMLQTSTDIMRQAGESVLEELTGRAGEHERIVEKSPPNFMHLGLIASILPNAKLIYCRRHPFDTCLSCYFHDFAGFYPFSYDLENLGRYYRLHEQLVAHWMSVLRDRVHVVQYEDLVANFEAGVRSLIDFVDLEWDDACLAFHENERRVLTSSRDQVRQPIYSTSVARWKRYEQHLDPLRRGLDSNES